MSPADPAPVRVAGVDGCPAGWVVVTRRVGGDAAPVARVIRRFAELFDGDDAPAVVAVDMPIGLPEMAGPGGRGPESLVRPHLGARQSSVFSVPSRAAVHAGAGLDDAAGYRVACAVALQTSEPPRKISKQAFFLFPKIREIDALLIARPELRERVFEVHPELAFWRLNGEAAMSLPKKIKGAVNPAGLAERRTLLYRFGFDEAFLGQRLGSGVGADDLLDAAVDCVIAERLLAGTARPFPDPPGRDARGLGVAIWA